MKESIAIQIRKIRSSKGHNQKAIALELDMDPSAYSKIERGEVEISASRLEQIAKFLQVPIGDFFIDNKKETTKLNEPKGKYGFATKGDIEELLKMLQDIEKQVNQLKLELKALTDNVPRKNTGKK